MKTKIICEVKNIIYQNETYYILKVETLQVFGVSKKDYGVVIKGNFINIFKGDILEVIGEWKMERNGYVFYVEEYKRQTNEITIKNYMRNIAKIGKITVEKIYKEYQDDSINKIKESIDNLTKIKGISKKMAIKIQEKILDAEAIEKLFSKMIYYNIDTSKLFKLYTKYKNKLEDYLKEPYKFLDDELLTFIQIEEISYKNKIKYNHKERIKGCIVYLLKIDNKKGNVFTYKKDLLNNINKINKNKFYNQDFNLEEVEKMIKELEEEKRIIIENNCIYYRYYNYVENMIVRNLKDLINEKNIININEVKDILSKKNLTDKQKKGIENALLNKISILTGGPRTGKTHTLNTLVKTIKKIDKSFCLLAPTGKASKRMAEMTNEESMTIHRKLQIKDGQATEMIEEDYLIIDESSMIDIDLFLMILESIDEHTSILLVGDHNQLPSVGVGSVFKDLIESNKIEVVELDEVFRQKGDSSIVSNSHKIIKDNYNIEFDDNFTFIEKETIQDINEEIINIVKKEDINNVQILTSTRELSNLINLSIQELNKNEVDYNNFKVNDRVIHTKNNYDFNVFNGEIGKVVRSENNKTIVEYDEDREIEYDESIIEQLELSYSITIHKSQGSEFDTVIIPIHNSQSFMNNRNLIYTAITRAKSKVILIGQKEEFYNSLKRTEEIKRNSNLVEKLNK